MRAPSSGGETKKTGQTGNSQRSQEGTLRYGNPVCPKATGGFSQRHCPRVSGGIKGSTGAETRAAWEPSPDVDPISSSPGPRPSTGEGSERTGPNREMRGEQRPTRGPKTRTPAHIPHGISQEPDLQDPLLDSEQEKANSLVADT